MAKNFGANQNHKNYHKLFSAFHFLKSLQTGYCQNWQHLKIELFGRSPRVGSSVSIFFVAEKPQKRISTSTPNAKYCNKYNKALQTK